jgi:hypothetical protein
VAAARTVTQPAGMRTRRSTGSLAGNSHEVMSSDPFLNVLAGRSRQLLA